MRRRKGGRHIDLSKPAQSVEGGLIGGQQQQPSQNTQGGGLFGLGGNNSLFGGASSSNQPSQFSSNNPLSDGLFGGGRAQPSNGGLFGGGGQTFGQAQSLGLRGNNTDGMGGQTSLFRAFGGTTQPSQGGGLFGTLSNTGGQVKSTVELLGTPTATVGGLFGGQQQQTQQPSSGLDLFIPIQTPNTGGLIDMSTINTTSGVLGGGNTGGEFNKSYNNEGLRNIAQPFEAKISANEYLNLNRKEKNFVYSISNKSDKCIFEMALVQRKMVKAGQLQPNPQSGIPQFGQALQQKGGLFGGGNQNLQQTVTFGRGRLLAAAPQHNNKIVQLFVAKRSANESLIFNRKDKNFVYSISNGSDKCIFEIALVQRKMAKKEGQLQPNPQSAITQTLEKVPQQQGGLFGGGNQNLLQTVTFGGGGLLAAAPQQEQPRSMFRAQPAISSQAMGGGGLFVQQNQSQPSSLSALFVQTPSTNSGGLLSNTTQGGGLFGQQTLAPQSGGLFAGPGYEQQAVPANRGELFESQKSKQTGGILGGQFQQPAQGSVLGALPGPLIGGGLQSGPNAPPILNTGFSQGEINTTAGGGLFRSSTSTNQPISGGIFGAFASQTSGLISQPVISGDLFGQTTTINSAQTTLTGGQFDVPQTLLFGNAGGFQRFDQVRGFQSLLSFLEITSESEQKKPVLDGDLEARWVYGKSRDQDDQEHAQRREGDKQSESAFTASEYQAIQGQQKMQQEFGFFKTREQKYENDKKQDIRNTFSASNTGGEQQDLGQKLKSQSTKFCHATAVSERLSATTGGPNSFEQKLIQQKEFYINFIEEGIIYPAKMPFKPENTYGDVKKKIQEQIIGRNLTLENLLRVNKLCLQAHIKGPNQPPQFLNDNEIILSSTIYSSIDYIELVEKVEGIDQSDNNSSVCDKNILEVNHQSGRKILEVDDKIVSNAVDPPIQKRFIIPSEFKISPSRETLEKLGDSALQRVENFSIENSFVKITYEEPINLLNADLTGLFFGENKISIEDVPSADRINKTCVIEFLKFGQKQLDNKKTPLEVQELVEKLIRKMNLDLVKPYDVKSTSLIYRQESFN